MSDATAWLVLLRRTRLHMISSVVFHWLSLAAGNPGVPETGLFTASICADGTYPERVHSALLAFRARQGMLGLPETGVSDAATWLALLGPNAQPADLVGLSSGDVQYNDDMADHSHDGSIYLVVRSCILANLSAPSVSDTFSSQE